MKVVTSNQMKQIEENSLAFDLTYARLMENAGSAAAAFIRRLTRVEGLNCMVFCGAGNNGGDGFVVARRLFESGANVVVVLVDGVPSSDAAQSMFELLERMEIPVFSLPQDREKIDSCSAQADLIVDAIYGTGFHGHLAGNARVAAGIIADAIAAVIALDVPSGVECDTAKAGEGAVKADFTIVFDSLKPVHVIPSAQEHCGKIETVDIGIPREAHAGIPSVFSDITMDMVTADLPVRDPDSHKGTYGTLLAICGSERYRGAASLAAAGALRSGVGICKVASVPAVCDAVAARLWEPVFLPLPASESGGILAERAVSMLRDSVQAASCILFGCGLGDTEDTFSLLAYTLRSAKTPVIVDADGINALAGNINIIQEANVPVILTPHPGEMARLCGVETEEIQRNRVGYARDFAAQRGVTLVLKGHETLVASPDGRVLFNRTGGPGLAKGGSGDILAGMIGAFCAQGIPPESACTCAVHLHGLAGDRAAARRSEYGMLPSELLEDLCDILLSCQL
ncbi:NAD(P)H-hydrate dehydratase [Ruminococcaceae bacterium OttesenSCG-928-L11]|nr:NAD(P)H-hydrate dehydratase [Ruminococcaceae bacterium OttesenSCG-928-L11]